MYWGANGSLRNMRNSHGISGVQSFIGQMTCMPLMPGISIGEAGMRSPVRNTEEIGRAHV